ncbi:MAG: PEGA domain-containing protein [bacterium]|nr:PEGA domain-containing protein [bacterium]
MEYPGAKLTRPIRRVILASLILAFLIISPLIIAYTGGYRYDWQNGLLKETGAISIDVEPPNATVYLNGAQLTNKIPIRLKNVVPQKYTIKITAPGYYDWVKDVEVGNKQTAYIKEIVLLQKNDPRLLVAGNVKEVNISPDESRLIYTVETNGTKEIWLMNLTNPGSELILTKKTTVATSINWSADSSYFSVSIETDPYAELLIINTNKPNKNIDLVKTIKYPIDKFQWKESGEPELFFSTKLKIMSYLPPSDRLLTLAKNSWLDWQMENGQLWTVGTNTSTNQYILQKDTLGFASLAATWERTAEDDAKNQTNYKILTAKNGAVLLTKTGSAETLLVSGAKQYKLSGEKFVISRYNNWWLMWTPWELWSYSANFDPLLLNRSGEQLQEAMPLDKFNTLGLRWLDKTTVFFPYYYVSHELNIGRVLSIAMDTNNRMLYYAGGDKSGLWELKY